MDSIFNDVRFWMCSAGAIFSALLAKIITSYDKQLENLFKLERENKEDYEKELLRLNGEIKEQSHDIDNLHSIMTGHLQYHEGLRNGDKK